MKKPTKGAAKQQPKNVKFPFKLRKSKSGERERDRASGIKTTTSQVQQHCQLAEKSTLL